ncbi:MAG: transaldolase family protein [Phycisphaeraceae bacterium]
MTSPLQSIVAQGTRLWLDSIDPDEITRNKALGASGATSNPIIVADLIKTGRFDDSLNTFFEQPNLSDEDVAWAVTDKLVKQAMDQFHDVWKSTSGNDGWVSFELDPLLEDTETTLSFDQRVARYIELGKKWSKGHDNRMIKVPATDAGIAALEELAAAGITLNVTLIFSKRQYHAAREAVWRGAQRRPGGLDTFKSVYSIFISRVDVYTEKHAPTLSSQAQGQVGLVNAKRLWHDNQAFWSDKSLKLDQEIIFASTGTKKKEDPADKYVGALVGSDIQTNPPATNAAVDKLGKTYTRTVDQMPPQAVLDDIDAKVDDDHLEQTLLNEGTAKFADPHKQLIALIAEKRGALTQA